MFIQQDIQRYILIVFAGTDRYDDGVRKGTP